MTELSIVIPVYGCDPCLRALHERLTSATAEVTDDVEFVFVDDRSPDGAWDTLRDLARSDSRVRALRLSRNFGQHAAITAGLAESRGRWVVVMDCDLQDPPEQIPLMYAKAQEGHDVVLCRRRRRRGSWARRLTGSFYTRLRTALVGGEVYGNYTNLSLISRQVADAFLTLRDSDRQYLLIVRWLGFRQTSIEVDQDERHAGRSAYNLRSLAAVAVDGIFFQTTNLLRWIVYAGFSLAGVGALLALYTLGVFALGRPLPAWTGLPVLILLLTGFMIISTGIAGLYVGKIFEQVKGRPLYVLDSVVEEGEEFAFSHRATVGDSHAAAARAAGSETDPPTLVSS